jgi:hypothetical protein
MVEGGFLVGAESVDVQSGRGAGHRGEFLPRDEAAAVAQRNQVADPVAVASALRCSL